MVHFPLIISVFLLSGIVCARAETVEATYIDGAAAFTEDPDVLEEADDRDLQFVSANRYLLLCPYYADYANPTTMITRAGVRKACKSGGTNPNGVYCWKSLDVASGVATSKCYRNSDNSAYGTGGPTLSFRPDPINPNPSGPKGCPVCEGSPPEFPGSLGLLDLTGGPSNIPVGDIMYYNYLWVSGGVDSTIGATCGYRTTTPTAIQKVDDYDSQHIPTYPPLNTYCDVEYKCIQRWAVCYVVTNVPF